MRAARRVVLAAAPFASACDGEGEDAPVAPLDLAEPPANQNHGAAEPEERPPVVLDNGFLPDPHVLSGTTVGTAGASTLAEGCTGFVSTDPDQVLETRGTFAELRILAHCAEDLTLAVERPDGTHLCDDDTEGTDPVVASTVPRGTYRIGVGSPRADVETSYRLGFSELEDVTAASLTHRDTRDP